MPRNWLSGFPSNQTRSRIVPDDVKARGPARTDVEHEQPHTLTGLRGERIRHHAIVHAVEHRVRGMRGAQPLGVEHVKRRPVDLAIARIHLGIELALHDRVFAIDPGRVALPRLDDHHPVHARCNVLEDHRRAAVVHEDAGIVERELELDRLSGCDRAVLVLRRDHRRMEIHRMHHRRLGHAQCRHRLVASVGHREADPVAHTCADRRAGNLVTKSPRAVLQPRRYFYDLVRGIEAHFLGLRGVESIQRRARAERRTGCERSAVPLVRDGGRR